MDFYKVPIGFGMALAMNSSAMAAYAAMTEEQKFIYYAAGESMERIEMLPQVEAVKEKGYEVLYLTDDVDEFALKVLGKYADKEFKTLPQRRLTFPQTRKRKQSKRKTNPPRSFSAL